MGALDKPLSFLRSWVDKLKGDESIIRSIIIIVVLLGLLAGIGLFGTFRTDDSFICFRYGQNLIKYGVWNWNSSGVHEEAYTTFTYTALSIIPAALRIDPTLFFKGIGLLWMLLLLLRMYSLSKSNLGLAVGGILVFLNPYFYIHAFSGLETPLFVYLVFEMIIRLDEDAQEGEVKWSSGLIALLLPLTRPEGAIFSALYMASMAAKHPKAKNLARLFFIALLGLAYFAIRWRYFGQPLPNPYYVKVISESGKLSRFVFNLAALRYFAIPGVFCWILIKKVNWRLAAMASFAVSLFLYGPADLMMNYAIRFNFQIMTPLFAVAVAYLALLPQVRDRRSATMLVILIAAFVSIAPADNAQIKVGLHSGVDIASCQERIGKILAEFKSGSNLLLCPEAGAIPYYSGWQTLDPWGLANKEVARGRTTWSALLSQNPQVVMNYYHGDWIEAKDEMPAMLKEYDERYRAIEEHGEYSFCAAVEMTPSVNLMIFVNPKLSYAKSLTDELRALGRERHAQLIGNKGL